MAITYATNPLSPYEKCMYMPFSFSRAGEVTLDTYYSSGTDPEIAGGIMCGTTGVIVLEGIDGGIIVLPVATQGVMYYIKHRRVLTSAVQGGDTYNTTALNIHWFGGNV